MTTIVGSLKHCYRALLRSSFNRFLPQSGISSADKLILPSRLDLQRGCVLSLNRDYSKRSANWGSKKRSNSKSSLLTSDISYDMATPEQIEILDLLREQVKAQGDKVRQLKADKADPVTIKEAVTELKARRKALEQKELEFAPKEEKFDRLKLEDLLKQRFFYDIAFSIYGGIAGQYDFGPMGCALKTNVINEWRKYFVLEEGMLEVDCSILTPEPVLQASGHVERFADYMVKDLGNGECFRVDHLIEDLLEKYIADSKDDEAIAAAKKIISQLDNYQKDDYAAVIKKYGFKSPLTGNELSEPIQFNLMFSTHIGPAGVTKGYLRPETAQGIFVNFKRLLEFNTGKLPFAAAQIGKAFRNEISPRSGLIRVREFEMAEIEHFVDPNDKRHPKFPSVMNVMLPLLSACNQMDGKPVEVVRVGDAVEQGLINNETLGYYMARTYLFFQHIGINTDKIRFRQHLSNEMAHYACDCWDGEIKTSYGWVECVGHADRSAYDLTKHYEATNVKLVAEKKLPEPKVISVIECVPDKGKLGKQYKKEAKSITSYLTSLKADEVEKLEQELRNGPVKREIEGKEYELTDDLVKVKRYEKTIHVEEFIPSVIEPSYGIGRVIYALFEHSFREREGDEQRTYLSLPPSVSPYKCSVLPLSSNKDFLPYTRQIADELRRKNISHKVDESSGSIGRRYARTDQIAIPFAVTIDFDTLKEPHSVTLRERDSCSQVRVELAQVSDVVEKLSDGSLSWANVQQLYPKFEQQEASSKSED